MSGLVGANTERAYELKKKELLLESRIRRSLRLSDGQVITKEEVTSKINKIYEAEGITKKVAATEIKKWYEVTATTLNGKAAWKIINIKSQEDQNETIKSIT